MSQHRHFDKLRRKQMQEGWNLHRRRLISRIRHAQRWQFAISLRSTHRVHGNGRGSGPSHLQNRYTFRTWQG
jgi:hypothetical protein